MNKRKNKDREVIVGIAIVILIIIGFFIYRDGKKTDLPIEKSGGISDGSDKKEETLTIYKNEKYGYEFSYPKGWVVTDSDPAYVTVSTKNDAQVEALLVIAAIDGSAKSVFKEDSKIKTIDIKFLGRSWKSFVCPEFDFCLEKFSHRKHLRAIDYPASWGNLNEIILDVHKGEGQEKLTQEAEKILATFKFTK